MSSGREEAPDPSVDRATVGAALVQVGTRDDAELVQAVRAGDSRAFTQLVERYQERLFSLARHYTRNRSEIEDIVQDAFVKAYRSLGAFQQQSSFATWIYRIAVNTALDALKRRGRSPVRTVEEPELARRSGPAVLAPDARMGREEVARVTREILDELPEIFRTVLVMREFEDLSYQEIADVLCISIGTVESRLFRARARFRERLLERHPEFAGGAEV